MTRTQRSIVLGLAGLAVVAAVAWGVGSSLDRSFDSTTQTIIHRPPLDVWLAVTDYDSVPQWHPEFSKAEMLSPTKWRGFFKDGFVATYEVTQFQLGRFVEASQVERDLPYWGRFSFQLEEVEEGTRLTIRSHLEVAPPLTRLVARVLARPGDEIAAIAAGLKRYVETQ
ncbi:MAG: SRPBCC family protein [Bryobacteraceae bacterium]